MTPPLAVVLGAAAAAAELRTLAAAIVEEPIVEEAIAAEQRIGEEPIAAAASRIAEATGIAERRFEGEHLQPALIMGVAVVTTAAATAIRTINIAAEAATTVAEFILAALR